MAENSQYEQIKKYLEDGNKITGLDALRKFGCYRLSASYSNCDKMVILLKLTIKK